MDEQLIFNAYGIKVETKANKHIFTSGQYSFLIFVADEFSEEEVYERMLLANHLHERGEPFVWLPLQNKDGNFLTEYNAGQFTLLGMASENSTISVGSDLANFHKRGLNIEHNLTHVGRLGQWKELWEKRTDQLERFWQKKCTDLPQNEFEQVFIEYFPYYLGMMENAIQYLADFELEDSSQNLIGTICHERFTEFSFAGGKLPFHWVFDHASRDIAEWIRYKYFDAPHTYHHDISQFMQDYMKFAPIDVGSAKLLYARLIFPVNFFEVCENFFTTKSENSHRALEERLLYDVKNTQNYEHLLRNFFNFSGLGHFQKQMRIPEWLA